MERSQLSVKWLEVFQAVARHGAMGAGARALGVSVSTASHHLSCLERAVGAPLVDHARRPLRLTPAGEVLLRRVDEALWALRKGLAETRSGEPGSFVRRLRIAHIEDFERDVGPDIADHLARAMPQCDFSFLSRPTHEILDLLLGEQVDIGIAATVDLDDPSILQDPFLRDPFVLVLPPDTGGEAPDLDWLRGPGAGLPLLRHSRQHLLGRRIEAQLRRLGLRFPERMEFESTHMVLSMVAAGRGWAITTALTFARSERDAARFRVLPFPGRAFSRSIALFRRDDVPEAVHDVLAAGLRRAARARIIAPTLARHPWLTGKLALLPAGPEAGAGRPRENSKVSK
ncbi:MAG: LysR family transcriptional regulator [Rhodobacteraceae bacterium HLUCCA08]|nr:MAG: LysR family transcriptional regulator [Rhodobacteraceae bacterium HLUCCA08]